ncbi:Thioredoxin-like fold protein [Cordyceps fumosorosea ARSEF 2679]|uniref:Thioredoxin-like fold protein n=1 Tax=Cordyceps fumosorosea (strain ARSEF 2679) TaxID=1081104 RepID=A0A167UC43_CORFA|nr:Thioredoxin-like fold protein [Cordyceps fumosorosea ARSEF 2679]OAA61437.1 Thioredoxin-like fold protein [Cordyceps fumosorosea ARSEF 2679]
MRLLQLALFAASAIGAATETKNEPTTFEGVSVPPLPEFAPATWGTDVNKTKFTVVKHYSPYCHHCIAFAPVFQTTYEFYHTLKSGANSDDKSTVGEHHGLQFAAMNCVAHSDFCSEHEVNAWPQTTLFKDGQKVKSLTGQRTIAEISEMIEKALEEDKPGSRPKELALPEAGATEAPKPVKKIPAVAKPVKKIPDNYNLDGVSVSLTAESFQKHVTLSHDPWFIKFYAPWCSHCQALKPTWEQLAKSMRGKLNIGEVNCDKEKRLCKDVHAKAFPTILFFKGGERVEYNGLRGIGDFTKYADSAIDLASGVPDIDAAGFEELEKTEEVIFVYFYDHAATSEDFAALERIPLSLIGHAKLVKTNDPELYKRFKITTWPRLIVSREGRPTYYTPFTPNEMRDVRRILDWMKSVWLPLVPELTATNARQIMENKLVVLGILERKDGDPETIQSSLREMKSAANEWMDRQIQEFQLERKKLRDAKQMRIEEAEDRNDERALRSAKSIRINMDSSNRKEVAFAWVDGIFWQRWLRTTYGIDIKDKDGERIIINDEARRKYWDTTATGNHILVSRTSIMETLDKIVYGPQVIKPKLTVSFIEKVFFDLRVTLRDHPILSLLSVCGFAYAALTWLRTRKGRRGGGHFRLDDSMGSGMREFKDGILGGGGNTKAD